MFISNIPFVYAQEEVTPSPISTVEPTMSPEPSPEVLTTPIPSPIITLPTPPISETLLIEPSLIREEPTISNSSATVRQQVKVRNLKKRDYWAGEKITVIVDNTLNLDTKVRVLNVDEQEIAVNVVVVNETNPTVLTIHPPRQFKPGRYKIEVTDPDGNVTTQDFTWGVLAINTNKSIYLPSETAKIAIAVLDETGMMVCNASLKLEIRNPKFEIQELTTEKGDIKVNPECNIKDFTLNPDYETSFQVDDPGTYKITLTAETENGIHTINTSFEVRESVNFDVERITATRIYPPKTYPVTLDIVANEDFEGAVTEKVPSVFAISALDGTTPHDKLETVVLSDSFDKRDNIPELGLPFEDVYPISQTFGSPPDDPILAQKYAAFGVVGHDGVDFALLEGIPVLTIDDGEVIHVNEDGEYGQMVVVEHSWGRSYYGHLSEISVWEGQKVPRGNSLGLSGSTGLVTGPHLHLGIKPNDFDEDNGYLGKINPLPYLGLVKEEGGVIHTTGIPSDGNSLTTLTWNLSLKKGDRIKIGYNYKAPEVSPQLYLLGPLEFKDNSGKLVFEEVRQWQIAVDAPNNQFVKQGNFTKRSGTGSQSVTGVGFKPKAVIFWWTDQTAEGTKTNASAVAGAFGMGFATGSANEAALSVWEEGQNAAGATDNGRATYNNASIVIQGTNGGLTFGIADFTSFDPDGFTLNWSTSNTSLYIIYYYAFSETILSNATVNSFSVPTSGSTIDEADTGFQPDFALLMHGGTSSHGVNTAEYTFGIGAAQSSTAEWAIAGRSDDAVDVSDTCTWQRTDATIALIGLTVACGTTTEDALVDFTSFDASGLNLNISNNPSSAFDVFYLALQGNGTSFKVGNFNKPTSASASSVTISSFMPAGVFLASRSLVASTTVDQSANGVFALGAASGVGQEGAISQTGDDAEDAYVPGERTSTTKAVSAIETDSATLTGEADLQRFNTDGFTLDWTTADATADEYVYWAIGEILDLADLMRHGKWFHQGTEQPFAF